MPQRNKTGHDQERVRNEASETTPLIPPAPTTVDASPEARLDGATTNPSSSSSTAGGSGVNGAKSNGKPANVDDDGHTLANQTISVARGILCTLALGFLIFLQATNISLITTTQSHDPRRPPARQHPRQPNQHDRRHPARPPARG
ncbi:hypothetical protein KC324_g8713 [Hortaea werneckii]|nr:hypothetical protein KC324_g8713 [Hortaea werneckii]